MISRVMFCVVMYATISGVTGMFGSSLPLCFVGSSCFINANCIYLRTLVPNTISISDDVRFV
jgi:hypothetical protein